MPAKEEKEKEKEEKEKEGEKDNGADGEKGEGESDQQQTDVGSVEEEGEPLLTSAEEEGEKAEKKKKGCSKDEVLAVLAHELGHWKCSHNLINLSIGEVRSCSYLLGCHANPFNYHQINLLLSLFMFGFFMNQSDLYTSFGFVDAQPVFIGLILFFQLIYIPYAEVHSRDTPTFSHVTCCPI